MRPPNCSAAQHHQRRGVRGAKRWTIDEVRLSYLAWLAVEDAAEELIYPDSPRLTADGRHPTYLTNRQREFLGLKSKDQNHPMRTTSASS